MPAPERTVTVRESAGADEIYAEWFVCPACTRAYLLCYFEFCPNCGVRLDWSKAGRA